MSNRRQTLAAGMASSRAFRLFVALLVTVPLVAAAVYMWMVWDPTRSVNQMPVAVVNEDVAVGQGNSRVNAGADVEKNLIDGQALNFQSTSRADAEYGLRSGKYYFVLEIPSDFSRTLAGIGNATVAPALINVTYNDNNTLKASQIGATAMGRIQAAVLKGVSATTVGKVLSGVDMLSTGLTRAADGSVQLKDGTGQLASGANTLSEGLSGQLLPGVRSANSGAAQLQTGSQQLATGAQQLQAGTDRLGKGADQVADGIDQLVGRVNLPTLLSTVEQIQSALPPNAIAQLDQVAELLNGLQRLQQGSRQVATELTDPSAAYRSGVDRLAQGSAQLDSGVQRLATGLQTLEAGTSRAATGAQQLEQGIARVNDGTIELSNGLVAGSRQAPDLGSKEEQTTLAQLIGTPVASDTTNLARAQFSGPGGAPTFLIIASMLVVIVVLMCFRTHRFVNHDETPRPLLTIAKRAVLVSAISLAAMAVVGIIVWNVLSPAPDPASLGKVIAITAAATLMNVALFSALFTLFGYVTGAISSLAWMMLQLFAFGGVWMIETLPAPLRFLHPISPMTYVRDGLISAFNGVSGFGSALVIIVVIGLIGAAITFGAAKLMQRGSTPSDTGQLATA